MQLKVQTAIFTLLAIILLSACAERYTMFGPTKVYEGIIDNKNAHRKFHSLDTPWNVDRLSNDRKQTKDPFNVCSPESYGDCAKTDMPHLSRY